MRIQFISVLSSLTLNLLATVVGVCTSRQPFSLDINSVTRTADVRETLTYDNAWYGDSSSVVKLRVNDADFAEVTGVGVKTWEPHRPGTYTITAATYQGGSIVGDVLSAKFEVVGRDLVDAAISFPDGDPVYDGTQRTPRVKVVYQGETLVEGRDYTVSYDENISGVGKVIVTGMGRFHDEVERTFKIRPAGICSLDICSGTRVAHLPETITYDENWFSSTGAGYVRIMENGTKAAQENGRGEYSWEPDGNGLYTLLHRTYVDGYLQNDVYSATFFVGGGSLLQDGIVVSLNPMSFQYDGTPKFPTVTVTHDGFALKEGQDYSVSYRDNVAVGTGYAVVTGMGKYEAVVEKAFSIVESDGIYRVSARQRYPWNGKVDLQFDSVGRPYTVSLVAKDLVGGTNIAMRTVHSEDGMAVNANGATVSPGTHRWVWDVDADVSGDFDFTHVSVSVNGGTVLVGAAKVLEMSVDGYAGTETLTNVPVLVRLSTAISGFSYADFGNANGGDLIFTDESGSVVYPHEIDEWHTGGESLVWVKLPQLKKGTKFKMGYGGTIAASASFPKTAVWSDYAGVWHMNEDSGTAYDSTAHGLDATPGKGTNTLADTSQMIAYENGACGRARVNGTVNGKGGSFLRTPASSHYAFGGEFVAGGWFRVEERILVSGTAGYDDPRLISLKPEFYSQRTGFEVQLENGKFCCKAQTNSCIVANWVSEKSWVNLVANYRNTNVLMYANGVLVANGTIKAVVDDVSSELAFGNNANGSIWSLNGQYDEIRLRGGSLSADRIKADYDMIANKAFLGYGAAYTPSVYAVDSNAFVLSIKHDGIRASEGTEVLTYSSLWDGGDDATVSIAQEGVPLAEDLVGEGERAWSVARNGTYTLTHTTYTNGVEGKVETATFVVTGRDVPFGAADVSVEGYTGVYDGQPHGIDVTVAEGIAGVAKRYATNPSAAFTEEPPTLTDVGSLTVWCEISAPGYITQTNSATVTITPRPVTLTSKSGTKVYDGTPLTSHEVKVGGDSFADGEGATYTFTGSQTVVGTSENTFTYTLNENTAAGNYEIATVNGTLTVTKASIGGGEGGDEPGDGDVPDGGLSKFDATVVYDGEGHTIDTNALQAAFDAAMIGESAVEYAAGGSQFTATVSDAMNCVPPCFTNAGEYVVWYRVTNPNYEDFVHAAKVTIAKRPVTLTSGTKLDFVYDGQPHAYPHFIKSGHDFVEGEGIVASNWATVTTVAEGEEANTFDYTAKEGTDLANYDITVVTGKIAVIAAPIPVGPGGVVTAVGYTNVYDGAAHGVAVSTDGLLTTPTVQYRADETEDWADASPLFGDVCDTQVWYRVSAPNYAPVVGSVGVRITPRPITLTSKSGTKVYDGTPLTVHEVTIGGDGFADGEGAVYTFTGSQTAVGNSENTFAYTLNENTSAGNYEIVTVNGMLTVTKANIGGGDDEPGTGEIPDGGLSKFDTTFVYDGEGHTVDTNALVEAFAAVMGGGETKVFYGNAAAGAAATGQEQDTGLGTVAAATEQGPVADWREIAPVYTNAGAYVVWYRVTNPNYEDFVHAAKVTIAKCPVTLTSGTKLDFVYDGAAHTYPHIGVSGLGFVAGEGVTTSNWATVTCVDEGEVANTFDYAAQEGTDLANYAITVVTGRIAVVAAPIPVGPGGVVTAVGYTNVYDGVAHGVAVSVSGLLTMPTVQYRVDEADAWADASPTFGDVCDTQVWYRVTAPNYTPVVGTVGVRITPRPITLTAPTKSKTYDGTPLTFGADDVVVGGDGYAPGEAFALSGFAPITEAGKIDAGYTVADGMARMDNYTITRVAGTLTVTPRPVTFTSKGATKVYDGTPLTAHEVAVGGDGFVGNEGATYVFSGSQTTVGKSENTFTYTLNENTAAGNYEIATVNGTLTVTKASIGGGEGDGDEPGDGEIPDGGISKFDVATMYDGEGHTIDTNALQAAFDAAMIGESAVEYAAGGSQFTATVSDAMNCVPPCFTNAGEYVVWYRVTNPNYEDFVHAAKVTIAKRPVTLTSKSETKVYDGMPLTAHEVVVGGDGFVGDEGATYVFTGSQTAVGTSENAFTYSLNENTAAGNYEIATVNGTLTVTKASIGGGEGDGDEPGDGEIPDGGISKFDVATMYDGEGHTIDTNALQAAFDAAMIGESAVEYAAGGSQFTATVSDAMNCVPPCFTNAGEYVVWYRVTNPNYEDFVHAAKVTITPRPVTLTSGTKLDFVYDGQPHACPHFIKSGHDFVEGEGIVASNWATVTTVAQGEVANTFDYAPFDGTDLGNYALTVVTGRIAVVAAPIPAGPGGAITAVGYTNVYDGAAHGITASVTGLLTTPTVQYRTDETDTWADVSPTFGDVCDTQVWYRVSAPNYAPVVGSVGVRITPRPITLTAPTKSKTYDGTPLTFGAGDVAIGGDGYAPGEAFVLSGFASIIEVGKIDAGYTVADGTARMDNYAITRVAGTLVVTPRSVTLTSKSVTKVYDGTPLTAHEVTFGGDGFVGDEGAVYEFTGSQTTVGTSENTFTYTLNENTAAGNYEITTAFGTLTVTKASIGGGEGGGDEPGDGNVPDGGLSKFDTAFVYDGEGHTVDTNALQAAFDATMIGESAVEYAAGGSQFTATVLDAMNCVPPCFTNAGEYVVWYRVTNPNYEDFVHAAKVTITPRPVTLTSKSGTKVYDGTPLTAHEVTVGGDGFVDGEGATYAFTGSQSTVGKSENTFTYTLKENTLAGNYEIATVNGTLTVTKASIGGDEGGGDEPGDGDVPDGGLSKFDVAFVYDGEGHTVDTNALVEAFMMVMSGGETKVFYGDAAAGAAATGQELDTGLGTVAAATEQGQVADWREVAPVYTNAGEYVVWYKVTNPNYEDFVHAAKVTITKRPVTVRSRNLTKPYNGTPLRLTADDIDVALTDGGQGLPALPLGESFAYGDFAERTAAGETAATFTVSAGAGTRLENYEVMAEYGTLTVTKATYPGQEPGGAGIAWSVASGAATWMYDGRPHGVALTGVPAGVTVRLAGNEAVDAGDYVATVTFDYDAANYEPPVAPAPLAWSITRRPLTLMAASKEKPYDGFPLAVRSGDITASGSGYADGECLDYFGFASITDVGETAATFSYRDSATAKVANYDVTVVGGQTLKVTVGGDQVSVTADSATWAYDGAEHRAATWRVENGDKLLAGHELRVAIDPASVIRTPADGPDGDGVVSNRFASVRIVETATGADRTRNYNLVLKEGVLKMTNACIRAEQVAGADDVAKVYDGVATQVVVTAALLQPATVRYWADGAVATSATLPEEDAPRFTHATNAVVWFTVTADYYNAYTGRVEVAIAKRPVTLTTPTKTKTYDGAPLTFGADEVEVGGDGFAPGESFAFSDFAAITDAGRVPARCAYTAATSAALPAGRGDGAAATGTRLADYAVTENWGTLTVRASADEITVTADSATWTYDGTAHRLPSYTAENADKLQPGDALAVDFTPESVVLTPEDGPDGDGVVSNVIASVRVLRHGAADVTRNYSLAWHPGVLRVTKARVTFDADDSVDPSAFSTTATYDGTGHTAAVVPPRLLTAPVTVRYYGAVATSATLPEGRGDGAVATSATLPEEEVWRETAPAFTNAGVHTVFYAIDARYYETYFGTATVTIAPRPVTLVSDGAEKVYDGTPLRCDAVRVKDGSLDFVGGEGFTATCSGALTDVGAMENLFDYALTGGARAGNYTIAKEYGWLRVTPATLDPGAVFGDGETDADGNPLCARVYNGAPQSFAPALDFGEPYRLLYALVPGDESAYSETAPTRTHVSEGDLTVYFKFLSSNYAPYYGKGTLRIVPKALTPEMCVADEDAAWFFDGTEKKPAVTVVDGDPNIATTDDYTLAYSGRTGAGLFPVTVTGRNNYTGTVTKAFAILKRPVAPPVIPSRAYNGRLQKPTITADARWTVVANPGGTDARLYTNVVLRLANTADYKWKGFGEDVPDWTGVFEIRKGANGWSTYPGIRSWTNGVEAASEPTGRARFGTLSVAYRRRGASVATETAVRPSAPGLYTARFWVEETKNYAGCGLVTPYEVDFEIFRGADDPIGGSYTTTTPVPVPYAWLDAYVARFGGGDYEAAAHATGVNGVALWASYVAGLDPTDAASRFTAKIAVGTDGTPRITWSPDLRETDPPRAYTVYGKPDLGAAAWTPVTDANRATLRFFKVTVELQEENR